MNLISIIIFHNSSSFYKTSQHPNMFYMRVKHQKWNLIPFILLLFIYLHNLTQSLFSRSSCDFSLVLQNALLPPEIHLCAMKCIQYCTLPPHLYLAALPCGCLDVWEWCCIVTICIVCTAEALIWSDKALLWLCQCRSGDRYEHHPSCGFHSWG